MTVEASSVASELAELEDGLASVRPADVAVILKEYREQLMAGGIPDTAAKLGTRLPDVALIDASSGSTSLYAVTGDKPAVIVFYRGAWCPYCNVTLRTYQSQLLPELASRSVQLIALSPQKPDGSLDMQQKHDLAFPVVSDPGNALAGSLGILLPLWTPEIVRLHATRDLDLTEVNADGTERLPMATVAVVDADNILRWIDVHPDYTTRTEVADILAAVDGLA